MWLVYVQTHDGYVFALPWTTYDALCDSLYRLTGRRVLQLAVHDACNGKVPLIVRSQETFSGVAPKYSKKEGNVDIYYCTVVIPYKVSPKFMLKCRR